MKQRLLLWLSVHLGKWFLRFAYATNRWDITGAHKYQTLLQEGQSIILAIWHGRFLGLFMNLAGKGYYGVAGTHADAEIISQIGARIGWHLLRGSSSDRGREVYEEIVNTLRRPGQLVAITPDGPKGPAKIPKAGVIRAAMKTGAPVIPVASQSTRRWEFTNWDTFVVAKPFGRTFLHYGAPLVFHRDDNYDQCVQRLKTALDELEQEVDRLAG